VALEVSIGPKVKAAEQFEPEVPAKPMPCVVNTFWYFEDLNCSANEEIGFERRL